MTKHTEMIKTSTPVIPTGAVASRSEGTAEWRDLL